MLTRLKVSGFKNLVDVDVRFGPFTCIAGANGVGKSNLFDAIRFLSALADLPLLEAAKSVRGGRTADVKSLFHRIGDRYDDKMSFEAEMIVPERGIDELGQEAEASTRFLRYTLELGLRKDESYLSSGSLEILKEELVHITKGDALKHLLFPHSLEWRNSVLGGRQSTPFISTMTGDRGIVIQMHQNRSGDGAGGKASPRLASSLLKTVLSSANAGEHRTAVVARRELQSWRLLQLEPSALREPDDINASPRLESDGSHLPATLYRLAQTARMVDDTDEQQVYATVANRLADLINDVREVHIDRDERRELLTLFVTGRDKTAHPARALSDGTLRFLALATIYEDPLAQGVLCLEEPENGIHPARIPAILRLLQDIATDTRYAIGDDNPLRQVIVNTHSPAFVSQIPDDALVVAEINEGMNGKGEPFAKVAFGCLPDTWREKANEQGETVKTVSRAKIMDYLNPNAFAEVIDAPETDVHGAKNGNTNKVRSSPRRVMDRPDFHIQIALPLFDSSPVEKAPVS